MSGRKKGARRSARVKDLEESQASAAAAAANEEEEEEDGGDDEEEEQVEEQEDDVDEEEEEVYEPPKKKVKKAAPKASAKKKTGSAKKKALPSDASLIDMVRSSAVALNMVVSEWIERYNKNATSALVELVNLLFAACGSLEPITEEDFESGDVEMCIACNLEDYCEQDNDTYPIVSKTKEDKKFSANFLDFWHRLVMKCQNSILFDEQMLDPLISWIVGLSSSTLRAFRHTATLTGLVLMKSLIEVSNKVGKDLHGTERILEAEKKKSKKGARTHDLAKQLEEFRQKTLELERFTERIFNGIFVLRYRDSVQELRAACIEALGGWIKDHPTTFLNDTYLKYLGWMLYDKSHEVRRAALKSLRKLYKTADFIPRLAMFTQRFKPRMIEMANDVNAAVASDAIELITILLGHDLLVQADVQVMYSLISADSWKIRSQAAQFVHDHLFDLIIADQIKEQELDNKNEACMRGLVQFIVEFSRQPEYPNTIVDALWDRTDVLQDWETMTSLLLLDDADAALKDAEQSILVVILKVAAMKAAGQSITVPARPADKSQKKKEERKALMAKFTTVVGAALPQLLTKFQADGEKIEELAYLPQLFELGSLSGRLQKSFNKTLDLFYELVFRHNEKAVHVALADTMFYLSQKGGAAKSKASEKVHLLLNEMALRLKALKLKAALDDLAKPSKKSKSEDALYAVLVALRRLGAFACKFDVAEMDDVATPLNYIVDQVVAGRVVNVEMCNEALDVLHYMLLWRRVRLGEDGGEDEVDEICAHRDILVEQLTKLMDDDDPAVSVHALKVFGDVCTLFSPALRGTVLGGLALEVDADTQNKALALVDSRMRVFADIDDMTDEEADQYILDTTDAVTHVAKLVVYGVFDRLHAATLLAHYNDHDRQFSDVIKFMLKKLRESSVDDEWEVVLTCLKKKYEVFMESTQEEEELIPIVELARQISLTYGFDLSKYRKSLQRLLSEGIAFALEDAPTNVRFLDVLSSFVSNKLPRGDRENTLKYIKELAEPLDVQEDDDWAAFHSFVEAIENSLSDNPLSTAATRKRKGRTGTRRRIDLSVERSGEMSDDGRSYAAKSSGRSMVEDEDMDESMPASSVSSKRSASRAKSASATKKKQTKSPAVVVDADGWMSKQPTPVRKGSRKSTSASFQSPGLSAGSATKKKPGKTAKGSQSQSKSASKPPAGKRKHSLSDAGTQDVSSRNSSPAPPTRKRRARV